MCLFVCVCVCLSEGQDRNSCYLNQPFPFRLVPTERDREADSGAEEKEMQKQKTGSEKSFKMIAKVNICIGSVLRIRVLDNLLFSPSHVAKNYYG